MPKLFNFLLLLLLLSSCEKNNEMDVIGTIINKSGCFPDSYLVAIENPEPSKHKFLRSARLTCTVCYNCSNAVFIRLAPGMTAIGTRITFEYAGTDVSCFSSSEAPEHIRVKDISRL